MYPGGGILYSVIFLTAAWFIASFAWLVMTAPLVAALEAREGRRARLQAEREVLALYRRQSGNLIRREAHAWRQEGARIRREMR